MSQFSEKYIAACREANLPRLWRIGDSWGRDQMHGAVLITNEHSTNPENHHGPFWLPRVGDLLDLLEAEGIYRVGFDEDAESEDGDHWFAFSQRDDDSSDYGSGPDRQTALLRLLLAVREPSADAKASKNPESSRG